MLFILRHQEEAAEVDRQEAVGAPHRKGEAAAEEQNHLHTAGSER